MSGRVFIIHRWSGNPKSDWYPWLKSELEAFGYEVLIPEMPETDEPKIEKWVGKLKESVGSSGIKEGDYFVGHSIGCQTILRYFETLPSFVKCSGVLFVAPWMHLQGIEEEEGAKEIAMAWIEEKVDFSKVRKIGKNFVCLFSDNDSYVPLSDKDIFRENLGAKIIVLHEKGHFTKDDDCVELPEAFDSFLKL